MGIVIKQSSISSVFTYLGTIIGFVNTVILFPAFLSVDQVGLLRVLPSTAFMLMPLAQLGLGRTLVKFAPEIRKKQNGLSQLVSLLLVGIAFGFALTASLVLIFQKQVSLLFAANSPLFNDYLLVALCLIFVLALHTFFEAYGRIFLKIIVINIIREILIRLMMGISVGLYYLQIITFNQVVWGLIVIYSLALALLVTYLIYNKELKIGNSFSTIDTTLLKRIGSYAGYSILGTGGGYVVLNIDQVMISSLIGLEANGIYTTAFFFAVMVELSRRAITQITTPLVSDFFESGRIADIKKIHQQISINQMAVGFLFYIGITSNLQSIYDLMPNGATYEVGTTIVYLIGISKLIDMTFSNNGEVITMSKHYRFNVISMAFLAVLMILMNYLLIPIYGINGAALATLFAVFFYNIVKLMFIKIKLGFTPFTSKNGWLLAIGIFVLFMGHYLPRMDFALMDIIYRSSIIVIVYGLLVYYLKISKEINGIIASFLLRLK